MPFAIVHVDGHSSAEILDFLNTNTVVEDGLPPWGRLLGDGEIRRRRFNVAKICDHLRIPYSELAFAVRHK